MTLHLPITADLRADERALLERIRAGDTSACALCIETHTPALYRLALRVTRDPDEAQDVLQDAFLSAFRAIDRFDGRSSLSTWLHRITYNAALMRLRKLRRQAATLSLDDEQEGDSLEEVLPSPEPEADALLQQQETAELLGDAVRQLPASLREAFVLREVESLSTAETARRLGISEGAVKVRLHRARRALREGDVLKIDVGVRFDGYHADAALTVGVGQVSANARRLIEVTQLCLSAAITAARSGNRFGDIGAAIQGVAEPAGFSVVREYTSHGVGRQLHEGFSLPNYGQPGTGMLLRPGLTLAIEPMINEGRHQTRLKKDGWTVVTIDGKLSAQFEHTVAVTDGEAEVLTAL